MNFPILKRRTPIDGDLARLRSEMMDRTFDRFFSEPWFFFEPPTVAGQTWLPPIDLSETENEVLVRAEIPGIVAKDLDISVTGNTLTITGRKQQREETTGENFYQSECRYGEFRRVVELPETADADNVNADYEHGVLTVRIAKKPGVKPRHIEIKQSGKKVNVGK